MLLIQIYEVQRYTLYSGIVSVPIIYKYIYLKHIHYLFIYINIFFIIIVWLKYIVII